ncbi:hypothetical protein AB9128_31635 [Streptomyces cinereoruber]|uniref:hypothetical protein n=1 Tax=Streptomyces cinereoruber TaxID=67260 RepID=UPI003EBA86DC
MTDTSQPQPSVQNTWNITVHGGAPQMGQGNVQHNTFAYDPRQLAAFANEVLAATRSAELSPQDRTVVRADAESLRTELAAEEPDPDRVRSLTQRVWQSARTYLPPVLATGAAQAVAGFLGVPIGF